MTSGLQMVNWTERRIRVRTPVSWTGTLAFPGGEESCQVIDFSPRGARVTASDSAPVNRQLTLRLTEHGEFTGRIVWRGPGCMGLKFQHLDDVPAVVRSDSDVPPLRFVG